jgi:hypothetical protein
MLPLRVRHPEGVSTISVDETGDVEALLQALASVSGLAADRLNGLFELASAFLATGSLLPEADSSRPPPLCLVKAGYPPKPLLWTSLAQPLASFKLGRNEQLIVSASTSSSGGPSLVSNVPPSKALSLPTTSSAPGPSTARSAGTAASSSLRAPAPAQVPAQPATSRSGEGAFVEVDGSYLVLNVVP